MQVPHTSMLSSRPTSWISSIVRSASLCWVPTMCRAPDHCMGTKWTTFLQDSIPHFTRSFYVYFILCIYDTDRDCYKVIFLTRCSRNTKCRNEWTNRTSVAPTWHFSTAGPDAKFSPVSGELSGMSGMPCIGWVEFLSDTFLSCPVAWAEWTGAEGVEATYRFWGLSVATP